MRKVKVSSCARETQDVISLVLEPVDGKPLPTFAPGAHIDVEIAPHLVRQYSLCPPLDAPDAYRIAIHREEQGRGGSTQAHATLRAGSELGISAPRNLFALDTSAPHSVLFAGGIGITPLLAMACELHRRGASFELHYSARCAAQAAFVDELRGAFSRRLHLHFSEGEGAGRLDLEATLAGAPSHAHLYVCGPRRLTDAVVAGARARGWSDGAIHRESFSPVREVCDADGEFIVVASGSGAAVTVRTNQTIVEALAGAGIEVPTACEQGICGTCRTRVRGGLPDHRDTFLTAAERAANTHILPCCSRSLTPRLLLEL